jgi:hypothetical protein
MVSAFNLYLFNRQGVCLHYAEWHRPKSVRHGAGSSDGDQRQMFSLVWALSDFASALNPRDPGRPPLGAPRKMGAGCGFHACRTTTYKLHALEAPSGLRLVLNTSPEAGDLRDVLSYVYEELYVGTMLRNPAYIPGRPFTCDAFSAALSSYLRNRGLLRGV